MGIWWPPGGAVFLFVMEGVGLGGGNWLWFDADGRTAVRPYGVGGWGESGVG